MTSLRSKTEKSSGLAVPDSAQLETSWSKCVFYELCQSFYFSDQKGYSKAMQVLEAMMQVPKAIM